MAFSQRTHPNPMTPRPKTTATSPGPTRASRAARSETASGSTSAPAASDTASGNLKTVLADDCPWYKDPLGECAR